MDEQNSDDPLAFDLFGAPVSQIRERWGRPSFAKTKENQQLVALLVGNGWSQKRVAAHLGCDEKTLRKHFSRELAVGADLIESMALEVVMARMRQGHVPSARLMLERLEQGRAAPPPPKNDPREPALGKKAQAQRDAGDMPTSWGDVLPQVH
ncbi:hypothetical protein FDP22_12555 [Paroceanicella profunda]|uniref:Uncharacterized protein n=1 Tax=Paroceanicella profunda TaxID=2579971 RepID=A0A5B8FI03_9RHOB|nr:hypothetical protein [Paroceanicella profunda]QDL92538.1 hypothetical protein FDP22_12555 [Paroceanicella profunda]